MTSGVVVAGGDLILVHVEHNNLLAVTIALINGNQIAILQGGNNGIHVLAIVVKGGGVGVAAEVSLQHTPAVVVAAVLNEQLAVVGDVHGLELAINVSLDGILAGSGG